MVEYQHIASICPNEKCDNVIKINQGGFPVMNDSGGWKLKCNSCGEVFIVHVLNPFDASYVLNGAEILEMREGTLEETKEWCTEEGIQIREQEVLIYTPEILDPIEFIIDKYPIYISNEGENLESLAYEKLKEYVRSISAKNNTIYQYYIKSRIGEPKFSYVFIDFESKTNNHTAVFYYNFSRNDANKIPSEINQFLLTYVTNSLPLNDLINGVYTRDNCLSYLNKLLIRWRGLYTHTVMIVPFVGYLNQKASTRIELWVNIKKFLQEPNAYLLTRHVAKSLLEKSELKEGIPVDLKKKFNLESTSFENMDLFLMFHAKFFGGVNDDTSEILKGSFNIQKNSFYENIDLQNLPTNLFKNRYLDPLKITLNDNETLKDAIYIDLRTGKDKVDSEWNYGTGIDLINKILK
ncbi:MAG: hypothetical protein PHE56_15530 [Bacteroidales bacterium]|nr:hypothetical protein [Bacteroidales bacterium]